MEPIEELFKTNLIRFIGERSLKEISIGAEIPYRSIQHAIKGKIPRGKNLKKLADYLGVDPGDFFQSPVNKIPMDILDALAGASEIELRMVRAALSGRLESQRKSPKNKV